MANYVAPLKDMTFLLNHVADSRGFNQIEHFADFDPALVSAVFDEAAKFAGQVLSPLNQSGDIEGCHFNDGKVTTPAGWNDAYQQFCSNGWLGLALPEAYGGQSLPRFIAAAVHEMWLSSNLSFVMFQALTQGAAEILLSANDDSLKQRYLEKLVTGEWATCMSLTEPGAGSDLGNIRTRAVRQADGRYRITGQKIYITYGEHDLTENIVHLVLAKTPDSPPGGKGVSLFIVPKYIVDQSGQCGELNDVRCVSIEHKTGLHGSPTCSISYGDDGGAIGELVGAENRGLEYMFILMNEARLSTGQQGVAIGEMGYQRALEYSQERTQGRDLLSGDTDVQIARHPDVKRMLMGLRAQVTALRALSYQIASRLDLAEADPEKRAAHLRFVALMTPIFKAFSTESGNLMAGTTIQIFGGMGFVEETGVAQLMRDIRVTTIYEGTTGIQANDLVFRKVQSDQGEALTELIADIESDFACYAALEIAGSETEMLVQLIAVLKESSQFILQQGKEGRETLLCGAVNFLELMGIACCSWMMMRTAVAAYEQKQQSTDTLYLDNLIALSRFYFAHFTPKVLALHRTLISAEMGIQDYRFEE
ncbi:acyl-CoA dehydrogenase [Amphritea atlantica]|uniref:Acyl-CoA dehydrogenase n=1 Tax=Amphritea atlantica TaxID=355243 RepID=A0A1H9KFB4_9GAMM|nr:acyl-CoA dehydrogenase [Amphritea atlantica]SEQ97749.1 acyl-CoA dehydrogenase [Amphritea atlantica]